MPRNGYEIYARRERETFTPREAVGELYNAASVALLRAARQIGQKDFAGANGDILRAEKIVAALSGALDQSVPMSEQLRALYDWFLRRMTQGNVRKDPAVLTEVAGQLGELRDAWQQAMRGHPAG